MTYSTLVQFAYDLGWLAIAVYLIHVGVTFAKTQQKLAVDATKAVKDIAVEATAAITKCTATLERNTLEIQRLAKKVDEIK